MSYSQRDIDDVAWGKRVVTPRMRRAKKWQSFKAGAGKVARATGRGIKYIGKETYESGKYI